MNVFFIAASPPPVLDVAGLQDIATLLDRCRAGRCDILDPPVRLPAIVGNLPGQDTASLAVMACCQRRPSCCAARLILEGRDLLAADRKTLSICAAHA